MDVGRTEGHFEVDHICWLPSVLKVVEAGAKIAGLLTVCPDEKHEIYPIYKFDSEPR